MKGVFMLWIDVELAWGRAHRRKINLQKLRKVALNVRGVLDQIFVLLENYNIPVTWAILGHLLLDHCSKNDANGLPHPDMPRPNYSWLKGDWYRYDPCTDVEDDPAWYGNDIVDKIVGHVKDVETINDLGCHSFSHQLFGDPGCGEELARAEVERCIELMKERYGIVPGVFAFPRDYVGHVNALHDLGFTVFRDVPTKLYPCLELEKTVSNRIKTFFSLFAQFLSYYFLVPPHVVAPREVLPKLWAVSGCLAYSRKPLIPLRLATWKAIKGVNKAIEEGKIFCMYTHLRDLGENGGVIADFEKILSYVDAKRKEGLLEVKTATKLVRELEHTRNLHVEKKLQ